jgi:Carboxypeptidase regulatory-like domain
MKYLSRVAFVLLCLLGLQSLSFAQQQAAIVGNVTDQSGAAVPGAQVTILNNSTGVSHATTSNTTGAFEVPQLDIGDYNVSVKAPGFKSYAQRNVHLTVSSTIRVDAQLQVGEASESITVSAEALQVQSESNEQSNLITGTEIGNLATNGRNVIGLAVLGTGVSSALPSFNAPTSVTADNNISFNGERPNHNLWMIDGGENYDRGSGGKVSTMPSQNAIGEFRVLTSNYSADYGFASGGTISMILQSGAKDFHGQAWEFFRNDALDANNYIANTQGQSVPKLRYNVYGFNVGGPIYIPGHYNSEKNKTFFFWNEEWRSDIQGTQSTTIADPNALARQGCFAVPTATNNASALKFPTDPKLGSYSGQAVPIASSGACAGMYQIPASLISPSASALLQSGIFPNPTSFTANGAGQYSSAPAEPTKLHEEIIRIDHNFNDKVSLMGHFIDDMTNQNFATSIWSSDNVPTVGSMMHSPSYSAVTRLTDMISPSVVNETTLQYDGNRLAFSPTGLYSAPSSANLAEAFPGNNLNRLPNINIGGAYGINYNTSWQPWWNAYNAYQAGDDLTVTRGNHNMKFGGSYMWFQKNQDTFTQTQGTYNFNGVTGDAFADFLLGDASSYSESSAQPRIHTSASSFGVYAMDNWHVKSNFTLNLGIRYEGLPQTRVLDNTVSNFYPGLYNTANSPAFVNGGLSAINSTGGLNPGFTYVPGTNIPLYTNGLGFAGQNGTPRQFANNYWNNWGPRVGFAWDVAGNGKTVIRSGFGMFYERIQGNDLYNMGGNPGFATTATLTNVYLGTPTVGYNNGLPLAGSTTISPEGIGQALSQSDFKNPTSMQWSFNLQQQLSKKAILSLAYVGNENYHQPDVRNINTVGVGSAAQAAVVSSLIAGGNNSPSYNAQSMYQYLGYSNIPLVETATNSHYESLQAGLQVRDLHGLTLNLGYTWSHELDYMSQDLGGNINGNTMDNQTVITNPANRAYDYGTGDMDRRQVFTASYVYKLPFFRNSSSPVLKNVAGGWEVSGITTVMTGVPITVYLNNGNALGLGTDQVQNRPSVSGTITTPNSYNQWFNTDALVFPGFGVFGDLGRGAITGPGRQNWDMTLIKRFGLGFREGANLEFRADAFNVFNHTQFSSVGTTFTPSSTGLGNTNSTLGKVTGVYDPRVLQLGLTLTF